MITIHFGGHKGLLDINTNHVEFYENSFPTIDGAIKFLKDIKVPCCTDQYTTWSYKGKKGIKNSLDGWVLINGRWLEEDFAKELIKSGNFS